METQRHELEDPQSFGGMTNDSAGLSPEDEFHAHLDVCDQCQDHPFSLCATGASLIRAAVGSI
jgi:hypothetical protein